MLTMVNNKKVMLINSVCGSGSTGRIVTGLYDILSSCGYSCMIAYGRGTAPEGYTAYRIGSDLGVNIHGVRSRVTDKHGFYSRGATRRLLSQMEEFNPDIVHLHNIHGYYLNVPMLFSYLQEKKKKVIWTLHDCWSFTGHCTHFDYIGCMKWQSGCFRCEQLKEYPKSVLRDGSRSNYMAKKELFTAMPPEDMQLVTPSCWLMSKVKESFLQQYPVQVIHTGIDLSQFRPAETDLRQRLGISPEKKVLLGVSNPWRERKGLQEFEKLSRLMSDRYHLVLVGLKDGQGSGLPSFVTAVEKVEGAGEMAAYYAMADMYVNLTLEDTFPTTNIEALACGRPVITYRSGGSPESLDTSCGIVVERNNIQGVLLSMDSIREELMRKNPRRYTEALCMKRAEAFDRETKFGEYVKKVYERL